MHQFVVVRDAAFPKAVQHCQVRLEDVLKIGTRELLLRIVRNL